MQSKGLLSSLTVKGGLIAMIPAAGAMLEALGILPGGIVEEATALVMGAIGGAVAIFGRLRAHKSQVKGLF